MRYYFIAGEKSGDLHGSNLIKAIKQNDPGAILRGIGGDLMEQEECNLFFHFSKINFFGFWEVFVNLNTVFKYLSATKKDILEYKPDVIILIDFSGYNMKIAKFAKDHSIKIFYYISPKVWAWNTGRAFNIKKLVDRMFVILPFEVEFYKQFDYKVDYVGNPIMDAIDNFVPNENFKVQNQLDIRPIIALLPGSRPSEVSKLLPLMTDINKDFPTFQFIVAGVSSLPEDFYDLAKSKGLKVIYDQTYDLLKVAEAAIVASGTATLETGLFNVPQVVVYKVSGISYQIAKRLIKVRDIALVNLITDKVIVKTLLQDELTKFHLIEELGKVIIGGVKRETILQDYKDLATAIGLPGASYKAGSLMVNYLKE